MTFAAALGAVDRRAGEQRFSAPPPAKPDVAAIEENKAMQQSIAQLGKEITALKASLEAANKSARTQIAKIADRLEHDTAPTSPARSRRRRPRRPRRHQCRAAAAAGAAHRRQRDASRRPARPWCADWTIHDARDGYVSVEGHGEIYQVAARRAAAGPRPGRIDQAPGRPLGGD